MIEPPRPEVTLSQLMLLSLAFGGFGCLLLTTLSYLMK